MKSIITIISLLVLTYILARALNNLSKNRLIFWYRIEESVQIPNKENENILWFMYFEIWADLKNYINDITIIIELPDAHIMDIEFNCNTTCNIKLVSKNYEKIELNIDHLAKDDKITVGLFMDRKLCIFSKNILVIRSSDNTEIIAKDAKNSSLISI